MRSTSRRRRWPWLLVLAFVLVPIAEIYVIIQVGQVIGAWWTVVLLIADSIFGSWLVRHEGARAWLALRTALASGRMPARELADGALILIGGTLMISPGFISDVAGFGLILPFTRPIARRILTAVVSRRLLAGHDNRPGSGPEGPVIRGEVVDP